MVDFKTSYITISVTLDPLKLFFKLITWGWNKGYYSKWILLLFIFIDNCSYLILLFWLIKLIYYQIRIENKAGKKLPQLRIGCVTRVIRILITLFRFINWPTRFLHLYLVGQFINLNSVIRILITPVTHPIRNWGNFFPTLFSIRIW